MWLFVVCLHSCVIHTHKKQIIALFTYERTPTLENQQEQQQQAKHQERNAYL